MLVVTACGGPAEVPASRPVPQSAGSAADKPADPLSAEELMATVYWLTDPARKGRGSYQPGGVEAANYVANVFKRQGLEVIRQPVRGSAVNVFGVRRGSKEAVIVSAHADHLGVDVSGVVSPGADDNASGTAVMLGMAKAIDAIEGERTIIFVAFGAEEAGLVGSRVYIRDPIWPLEDTVALINFDMVGRNFFEAGANREATAAVVGLEGHEGARRAATAAAQRAGLNLVPAPARLLELFGFEDRTDEWWFRRQGILSIHFSTGLHDDYHQPTDTPDKLVPAQLERVARTAFGLLNYLASEKGESID